MSLFPDLEDMPLAIKILKEAGLSAKDAWEIWQTGFDGVEKGQRPEHTGEDEEGGLPAVRPGEGGPAETAAGLRQGGKQHGISDGGDQEELRQS